MGLTPEYECADPDRYVPEDFHEKVEFIDMVWPDWVIKKDLNRKQINAIPKHKRPVQKEYKTVID
eukprot:13574906-Alexandrium_andersonii.AAC.1